MAETNIKEIQILEAENDFIRKKARANFKTLGKKLGTQMKWAAAEIEGFSNETITKVQSGDYLLNRLGVDKGEAPIVISRDDIEIITDEIPGYEIAGKGNLTVALDITITQVLKDEGNAREFVNKIQTIRKETNLSVTDRIDVDVQTDEILQHSLIQFKDYICREILAEKLEFSLRPITGTTIEVNDAILNVNVTKTIS